MKYCSKRNGLFGHMFCAYFGIYNISQVIKTTVQLIITNPYTKDPAARMRHAAPHSRPQHQEGKETHHTWHKLSVSPHFLSYWSLHLMHQNVHSLPLFLQWTLFRNNKIQICMTKTIIFRQDKLFNDKNRQGPLYPNQAD